MYITKAEREYVRSLAFLRSAQYELRVARLLRNTMLIKAHEGHVLRMLVYAFNAQEWVMRQRKRNPGRVFTEAMSIPFTLDVAA